MRSRDGVLPASHLLSSKMQGNEVEAGNTPAVRSWEIYFRHDDQVKDYFPNKAELQFTKEAPYPPGQ